jgi:hypothetical protein
MNIVGYSRHPLTTMAVCFAAMEISISSSRGRQGGAGDPLHRPGIAGYFYLKNRPEARDLG